MSVEAVDGEVETIGDLLIEFHDEVLGTIEENLFPPEAQLTTIQKLAQMGFQSFMLLGLLPMGCATTAFSSLGTLMNRIQKGAAEEPTGFKACLAGPKGWDQVKTDDFEIPTEWDMGVATCEYQISGMKNCPNSQWATWEEANLPEENRSLDSADHIHNVDRDVALLGNIGAGHYRFSVEWSNICPKEGIYNEEALEHYAEECRKLIEAGIEPMVTLHHFSDPQWFADKGGWTNPENIPHFVEFAEKVFEKLSPYVNKWVTLNEPNVVAFSGFVLGDFPPNHIANWDGHAKVLANMYDAHARIYEKHASEEHKFGIVHQHIKMQPYSIWNPTDRLIAYEMTKTTNDIVLNFFRTGVMQSQVPLRTNGVYLENRNIRDMIDFIGLQYYVRPLVGFFQTTHFPGGSMTDMPFREDPAGIYQACMEVSEATGGKPIFITETGISTQDEAQRARFYERVLYSIGEAAKDGCDIQGVYLWSLYKNFEWNMGWDPQDFGIYAFDRDNNTFELRQGSKKLQERMVDWRSRRATGEAIPAVLPKEEVPSEPIAHPVVPIMIDRNFAEPTEPEVIMPSVVVEPTAEQEPAETPAA